MGLKLTYPVVLSFLFLLFPVAFLSVSVAPCCVPFLILFNNFCTFLFTDFNSAYPEKRTLFAVANTCTVKLGVLELPNMRKQSVCMREKGWCCRECGTQVM